MRKVPKYLADHPAVEDVEDLMEQSWGSYRWSVLLKAGWHFSEGTTAGCRSTNINNKADFLGDCPTEGAGAREIAMYIVRVKNARGVTVYDLPAGNWRDRAAEAFGAKVRDTDPERKVYLMDGGDVLLSRQGEKK